MSDSPLQEPANALTPETDVETRLLYNAYERKPLNVLMTASTAFVMAGLLWRYFPTAQMTLWAAAIMMSAALGYLECRAFKRAEPTPQATPRWRNIFLAQSTLAGATWALGPCLMIANAAGVELTLLITILLAVCTVAMISMAEQRTAMMAFVSAVVAPPALVLWRTGGDMEGLVALALTCGMVLMIFVSRRLNQTMRDLLESQGRTRAILDTSLDAIVEMDAQGRITDWNRRAEMVFGWNKDEALGLALDETIIPQQHRAAHRNGLDNFIKTGAASILNQRTEITALRQDGSEFPVEITIMPLQAGVAWHFTAFITDITERKNHESSLASSNKRLNALIEAIPDAIFLKDSESRWLVTNEPAKQLFQLHGLAWQNKTEMELAQLHPEFRAAHEICLAGDQKAWEVGHLSLFLETMVDHGLPQDFEVRKMPIFDEQGERQALLIIGRNITDRKQAEQAQRIAATAFESQQGMAITDAQRLVLRVNKTFTEITGYSAAEVVGRNPRLLASGRHDSAFYAAMWASIERDGSWQGEIWNRRKSGEIYPEWLTISAVKDAAGRATHYVAAFTDITSRKTAEDQINNLAFYDPLTHLPNRRLLMDRLEQAWTASVRRRRKNALLFIDLDNFKTLNDTLGYIQGDLLLEQVAKRLTNCVREGDTVARLGGDEFVMLLEDLSESELEAANQAKAVSEKILFALNQSYQLGNGDHHSTPSIGVALFGGEQQESIDAPLKHAELAMYQTKTAGRNAVSFYDPQMQVEVAARAALEADLRAAVLADQFILYYQAQVVGDGRLTGVEALVRWQHPKRGLVPPAEFIALAEETGLILPLGQWVLETACKQLAQWATRPETARLSVAVNVSARQFHHKDFVDQVLAVLEHSGANPKRLKLELTESLLVDDVEGIIAKMSALKAIGVSFSLDDFGTGYSSLSYLKRLPLDQLKIDQGFVRNILTDPNDAAIAKMVIVLAESLGLTVIAEGVEIEAQKDFLAHQGCHAYQGYFFGRPMPVGDFEAAMQKDTLWAS